MLNNNKVNVVLSLLIAIALWFYVVGQVNPNTTKKITDVPIIIVNEEVLNQDGLAIAEVEQKTVDVTIEGNRNTIKDIQATDINVTADVGALKEGQHPVTLSINVPGNVTAKKISAKSIKIKIEQRISKKFPVEPQFSGLENTDVEPGRISVNPETIEVSGAASLVNKVNKVIANVDTNEIKEVDTTLKVRVEAIEENGQSIEHLQYSEGWAEIEATLMKVKTVSLEVLTTGEVDDSVELDRIEFPDTITIKGPKEDVKDIEKITAEKIDIGGITATTSFPLVPQLPKDIEIASGSKKMELTVKIKEQEKKTVTYDASDLKIDNLGQDLLAFPKEGKITVTLLGSPKSIESFSKGDLILFVDLLGKTVGEDSFPIQYTTEKKIQRVTIVPEEIVVDIKEE